MILSAAVALAIGEAPGVGVILGLSRCIWRNHFMIVNPEHENNHSNDERDERAADHRDRDWQPGGALLWAALAPGPVHPANTNSHRP